VELSRVPSLEAVRVTAAQGALPNEQCHNREIDHP
jgi:hypothetical protein